MRYYIPLSQLAGLSVPLPSGLPILQDVGSKLKTSVNGTDTGGANVEVSLNEGDLVKVGTTASVLRFVIVYTLAPRSRLM